MAIIKKIDQLFFATTSTGKVDWLVRELAGSSVLLRQFNHEAVPMNPWKYRDVCDPDVREVAKEKAIFVHERLDKPVVVQSTSLVIPSLKGFPATQLGYCLKTIGEQGIVDLLRDGLDDNVCHFELCLAYMDRQLAEPQIFFSRVNGRLHSQHTGWSMLDAWLPLWCYFSPQDIAWALASLSGGELRDWRESLECSESGFYSTRFRRWLEATGRV